MTRHLSILLPFALLATTVAQTTSTAPAPDLTPLDNLLLSKNLKLSHEPDAQPSQFLAIISLLKKGDGGLPDGLVILAARDKDKFAAMLYSLHTDTPFIYACNDLAVIVSARNPGQLLTVKASPQFRLAGDLKAQSMKFEFGVAAAVDYDINLESLLQSMKPRIESLTPHPELRRLDIQTTTSRVAINYNSAQAPFLIRDIGILAPDGHALIATFQIQPPPPGLFKPTRADLDKTSLKIQPLQPEQKDQFLPDVQALLSQDLTDPQAIAAANALGKLFPPDLVPAALKAATTQAANQRATTSTSPGATTRPR